ncbi:MAG: class I poly(R)-hydroxyalkanoic acid synthase, partial [Proteobacteria bacterium]|nr:class I poly(R)-hydroxyalkanoic acid synthase [Pseudomonadota bacterium]
MAKDSSPAEPPDPDQISAMIRDIGEQSQRLVQDFLERQGTEASAGQPDPMNIGAAFLELGQHMIADPSKVATAQAALWQGYMDLWQATAARLLGGAEPAVVEPASDDRRFKDPDWQENLVFDYIKQSYLMTARWMQETVHDVEGLDDKTAQKVDFHTRQFVDAMAPSNFLMTNPQVLRATAESGGENLLKGLKNLLDDLERGKGQLSIKMTDTDAFQVGGNIATTPGKV